MPLRLRTAAAALVLAACSGSPAVPPVGPVTAAPAAPAPEAKVRRTAMAAERIALVPGGTFGPYTGERTEGTVVAWAADEEGKRRWFTLGLTEAGRAVSPQRAVADAPAEVDLVAVRPLGTGERTGFVLLSSSREFSGERVDAVALGLRGELAGGPVPLAQSQADVVWLDAVQTASGALALWAARNGDRADIHGVELGPSGELRDTPTVLVSGVRAWQVAPVAGGAAIAALGAGKSRGENGPLRVVFVDREGHLEKHSVVVSDGATASPDLDLARVGERLVVAWSDSREGEPRVYGAVVDAAGKLMRPAAALTPPFGAQALLKVVPSLDRETPAYLAWENLAERRPGARAIRITPLSADGDAGPRSAILHMAAEDGLPELASGPKGVAALTLAPMCRRGGACGAERAVPTYVQLDPAMDVVASEPLRLEDLSDEPVDLAWGLSCTKLRCAVLAAAPATPAPVYSVELGGISELWEPAAYRADTAAPPRGETLATVGEADSVAAFSAVPVDGGRVVAWVSYVDPTTPFARTKAPAPDGKYEEPRGVVRVRVMPERGLAPEPVVLSYRAHSPGGVSLAPGEPGKGQVLLAWAGIDQKEPQVFLTLLGPDGKKSAQKMLTHGKGGVSDVSAAFVGDGWVVAWIAERGTTAELRASKVDLALRPVVPERRLGAAASVATSVQLLARGEHVVAVWSEARGAAGSGADVFAARVAARDLSLVGPARALMATPGHSRSPALAAFGEGAVVTWVEEAEGGTGVGTLKIARLDSGAEPVGAPGSVALDAPPSAAGLSCDAASCRVAVVTADAERRGAVEGLVWRPDGSAAPRRIIRLPRAPRDAIAPLVLGADVLYAEEDDAPLARVRRLGVVWE